MNKAKDAPKQDVQKIAISVIEGLQKLKVAKDAGNPNVAATKTMIDGIAANIAKYEEKVSKTRRFRVQSEYRKRMRSLKRHSEETNDQW